MPTSTSTLLDPESCYRALESRDRRFDGRFVTAVATTGIYCRPSCPAQTPKPQNVTFYRAAAAAEAAGFRACRRCRPDAAPGSPDWDIRADLTGRALRLIADGLVDSEGVAGLARRLAVSERHLHRQLVAELGVGPLSLARSRRAQTARLLIDQTGLSLSDIAFLSGHGSIRQFNDTIQTAFGATPSDLRRRAVPPLESTGGLRLRLALRLPYAADPLYGWLATRAVPGVEEAGDGRYRRTLTLRHGGGRLEADTTTSPTGAVAATLYLDDLRDLTAAVARTRHLFDLDADPDAVDTALGRDEVLAPLVAASPGIRVPGAVDGLELAVRAVLGQQVTVAGARTLAGRLVTAYGTPLAEPAGGLTHRFPTADQLAAADFAGIGLTGARVATLRALAVEVAEGRLVLDRGADRAETTAKLLALPGVGAWTAAYTVLRALGDPDAFPGSDLGLRKAATQLGIDLTNRADSWRPWRGYAAMHLWRIL
jgi:AraC family transcriptional regulator of adaptative response / DNA-3-methyladenine glycosylase II